MGELLAAEEADADTPGAHLNLGALAMAMGEPDKAIAAYEKAMKARQETKTKYSEAHKGESHLKPMVGEDEDPNCTEDEENLDNDESFCVMRVKPINEFKPTSAVNY